MAKTSLARFLLLHDYYSSAAIYMELIKNVALMAALAPGAALSASAATITLSPYDVDLFKCIQDHDIPDSGATVMLLGVALAGLALMRRYLGR